MDTTTTPGFAGNCGQSADSTDNLRTGNSAPTPDYGEPWKEKAYNYTVGATGDVDGVIEIRTREELRVADAWNPSDENEAFFSRAVACVNACAGMADPAAEIEAMREAIKNASHFASCILTETGRQWQATQPLPDIVSIEAVAQQIQDELEPFIPPGA